MTKNIKVAVIGAGMMGSAMAVPAADNGHQVRLIGTPLDRAIIEAIRNHDPEAAATAMERHIILNRESIILTDL